MRDWEALKIELADLVLETIAQNVMLCLNWRDYRKKLVLPPVIPQGVSGASSNSAGVV